MQDISILIPAAGTSSRMRGIDKLVQEVEGLPLLRRQAMRAIATGSHVCVTLPDHDHARAAVLAGLPVQLVAVPDADMGMSSSFRRGIGLLPPGMDAVIVLPADMPELDSDDIALLINGFRASPFPMLQQGTTEDGVPGHPVLFPKDCFMALQQLQGDQGARDVLKANGHRLRYIALPGQRSLTDLDTPEAWAEWRAERIPAE